MMAVVGTATVTGMAESEKRQAKLGWAVLRSRTDRSNFCCPVENT